MTNTNRCHQTPKDMDIKTFKKKITPKLQLIEDNYTSKKIGELITYTDDLEKELGIHGVDPKPTTKGEVNAAFFRKEIEFKHLPAEPNEKEENRLKTIITKLLLYTETLEEKLPK